MNFNDLIKIVDSSVYRIDKVSDAFKKGDQITGTTEGGMKVQGKFLGYTNYGGKRYVSITGPSESTRYNIPVDNAVNESDVNRKSSKNSSTIKELKKQIYDLEDQLQDLYNSYEYEDWAGTPENQEKIARGESVPLPDELQLKGKSLENRIKYLRKRLDSLLKVSDASGDAFRGTIEGKELGTDDFGNKIVEVQNQEGDVENVLIDKDGNLVQGYNNPSEGSGIQDSVQEINECFVGTPSEVASKLVDEGYLGEVSDFSKYNIAQPYCVWFYDYDAEIEDVKGFDTLPEAEHFANNWDLSYVQDSSMSDRAAEFAITQDNVYDLWTVGKTVINLPSGIDTDDFIKSCIHLIKEMWGEPEVNFDYGDVRIGANIKGTTVELYVK